MTPDAFWTAVNEVLDRGGDPLEDACVQAHLLEHPEDLALLDRLQGRLALLERAPASIGEPGARGAGVAATPAAGAARATRRPALRVAAGVAAAALVVVGLWWLQAEPLPGDRHVAGSPVARPSPPAAGSDGAVRDDAPDRPVAAAPPTRDAEPVGAVLDWQVRVTTRGPRGTRRTLTGRDGVHTTFTPRATDPVVHAFVWSETWTRP